MTVTITRSDFNKMYIHALSCCPEEACGLISGSVSDDGTRHIEKVYILINTDHTSEHFSIDPKEQLTAVKDMRINGLAPLGNWHSHPGTPSRPSEEDKRLANDPGALYLILSLAEKEPVLNAFSITGRQDERKVMKEELVILEE